MMRAIKMSFVMLMRRSLDHTLGQGLVARGTNLLKTYARSKI